MKVEGEPRRLRMKRVIPLRALIPNAITIAALCAGLTAVRFAVAGDYDRAVLAIIVAGVLDGIDGRVARLLKGTSKFGAELDSLSDVTAFGVAPALIIYFWFLDELPKFGWVEALAHAVCAALRLARFNSQLDVDDQPHKQHGFLTGVPAPVGAGLTLSPMFLAEAIGPTGLDVPLLGAGATAIIVATTAFLMVSNLPTYSWKSISIRPEYRLFALVFVALFVAALLTEPFMTLSIISIVYAATIPFSIRAFRRVRRLGAALPTPAADRETQGPAPPAPDR